MEEKKEIVEKTYTESEVRQFTDALRSQNVQLIQQLHNANISNIFKRLEYLFKVLEFGGMFDSEFVNGCIKEITELMTIPEKEEDEEE